MAFGKTGERRSILRPYVNLSTKKSLDLFRDELCEQRNVIKCDRGNERRAQN